MSKQKSFWDTKATIHIPLTERDLYVLDLLAEQEGKRRAEIIENALYNLKTFKKLLKEFDKQKFEMW